MTDNEKLIEWARSGNHLATRPGLVLELADALEAAEKALTPTEASAEHQKHADARRDETMTLISHAEPQREPSDARVLEDFLGKLAGDGAYTLDFSSAASLHDHIVRLLKRDIAALRAAGGVR